MISIQCDHCGKDIRVPDDYLGTKIKCPKCAHLTTASIIAKTWSALNIWLSLGLIATAIAFLFTEISHWRNSKNQSAQFVSPQQSETPKVVEFHAAQVNSRLRKEIVGLRQQLDDLRATEARRDETVQPAVPLKPEAPQKNPHYKGKSALEWAELMSDKDNNTRHAAAVALASIGADAESSFMLPAVSLGLEDENLDTQSLCAWAFVQFQRDPRIVPIMINVLKNSNNYITWATAANTLGKIRGDAKQAIPILRSRLSQTMEGHDYKILEDAVPQDIPYLLAGKALKDALVEINENSGRSTHTLKSDSASQ